MAGVPLPMCSGGRAIHDPQQGAIVLFRHPVPYVENRKIKLYELIFKNVINSQQMLKQEFSKKHTCTLNWGWEFDQAVIRDCDESLIRHVRIRSCDLDVVWGFYLAVIRLLWSGYDQRLLSGHDHRLWSFYGQAVVRVWSDFDLAVIRMWSESDHVLIRPWSETVIIMWS
jgi:hypothetical protein